MFKSTIISIILLITSFLSYSQEFEKDDVTIRYKNEWSGGVSFHTTGLGLEYRRAYHKTGYSKFMWTVQGFRIKHPKEVKSINPYFDKEKSFVYGKQNSLYTLRLGGGYQKVITGKNKKGNIETKYILQSGLSLALLKPNYLEVLFIPDPVNQPNHYVIRTEEFDINNHNVQNIYSKAPFRVGLGEVKPIPGLFFKGGINFEYGYEHDDLKAIEAGIMIDAYPSVLPLMVTEDNNRLYINLYVSFLYGRKWY